MPASPLSRKPLANRRRTKTYTGCWTCRTRRVKCDEGRPHCQQCSLAKLNCEGYDIRLEWVTNATGDGKRKEKDICSPNVRVCRRRQASETLSAFFKQQLSNDDLTAFLIDLERCAPETSTQTRGPYSVFSISTSHARDLQNTLMSEIVVEKNSSSSSPNFQRQNKKTNCSKQTVPSIDAQFSSPTVLHHQADLREEEDSIVQVATRQPSIDEVAESKYSSLAVSLDPWLIPPAQAELLHHYATFLSTRMPLVYNTETSPGDLFVPMALAGLQMISWSSLYSVIFDSLCSAAAFNLWRLKNDKRYQRLALRHEQLALLNLRERMILNESVDEITIAAPLTCIGSEAMSGRKGRWRVHVKGGLALFTETDITSNPGGGIILQNYFAISVHCGLPVSTALLKSLDRLPKTNDVLEKTYGTTRPLLQSLNDINLIKSSSFPPEDTRLDRLESQIRLNAPPVSDIDSNKSGVVQLRIRAFYYAVIIYFQRTLRRTSLSNVQDLVVRAVSDLEAAEQLSAGGSGSTWPYLVIGAECGDLCLQARMSALFEQRHSYGFGNINTSYNIVKMLWSRRAMAGPHSDLSLQNLVSDLGLDILPAL